MKELDEMIAKLEASDRAFTEQGFGVAEDENLPTFRKVRDAMAEARRLLEGFRNWDKRGREGQTFLCADTDKWLEANR